MSRNLFDALGAYDADDLTCKLLRGIYAVVPYSPEFPHYNSVDDAVRALDPNASEGAIATARALSVSKPMDDVLWMANLLDSADKGYAVFNGVTAAWSRFWNKNPEGLELDPQQRNDAVAKAIAISYMVYKAFPGTLAEKAAAFRTTPSGQAIAIYYGSVEVALPFADNLAEAGTNKLNYLFGDRVDSQMTRLASLAGGRDITEASGMLDTLLNPLEKSVGHTAKYVDKIADAAKPYLPGVVGSADRATGMMATAADIMPVYRLLGARLAAEGAAYRALHPEIGQG